jgi:hypothetical protein
MSCRYRGIGNYLVCRDQAASDAIATLGFGFNRLGIGSIGISKSLALRAIRVVLQGKVGLLRPGHDVDLPVSGQLALRVHRGYKVFDFTRSEVTKVFDPDASRQSVDQEVDASIQASSVPAAPRHLEVGPKRSWYTEEYVCGTHATQMVSGQNSQFIKYYSEVEKCQLDLLAAKSPMQVETLAYLERLATNSFRPAWIDAGVDGGKVERISDYIKHLRDWLIEHAEQQELQLVLSHGDFSLVNAISTDAGLRFIDWEGLGPGSLLSDVYNFVFVERYYRRSSTDFAAEASDFVNKYCDSLISRFPELTSAVSQKSSFARRLYYLERLKLMLEREVSRNLCDVICKSIEMFEEFDKEVGDDSL